MLVRATRAASMVMHGALFYSVLFAVVVIAHLALTSVLREQGLSAAAALTTSGALVLGAVLIWINVADWTRERLAQRRERRRLQQRLPEGPCCVVWRETGDGEDDMPWEPVGPVRARYPSLARRLGVEGVAVAEFEVSAGGRAKNMNCVDAWPSDVFYEAAREALSYARFQPKYDEHVRFGASYRMPFVFRLGGARREERGRRARTLRPRLQAAQSALEKLTGGS